MRVWNQEKKPVYNKVSMTDLFMEPVFQGNGQS